MIGNFFRISFIESSHPNTRNLGVAEIHRSVSQILTHPLDTSTIGPKLHIDVSRENYNPELSGQFVIYVSSIDQLVIFFPLCHKSKIISLRKGVIFEFSLNSSIYPSWKVWTVCFTIKKRLFGYSCSLHPFEII